MIRHHKNDNVNITFVKEPYKHYHKHMFRRFQIFQNSIRSLMQHVLECFWPILKLIHAVSNRIVAYHCNPCISSYERDEPWLTDVEWPPGGDINDVLKNVFRWDSVTIWSWRKKTICFQTKFMVSYLVILFKSSSYMDSVF